MSIISLFSEDFFKDIFTLKHPLLGIAALVCLLGSAFMQWKLNTSPKRAQGKYFQYYLAFALIVFMIVIDMVQLFFKGSDGAQAVIRNVFGLVVCGIIGMAASAGVWYLKYKKGKGTGENE